MQRSLRGLQLKIRRASGCEICELLKNGEVDLAISGSLAEEWKRLDAWPMLTESFDIVGNGDPIDLTVEVFRNRRLLDFAGADDGDCPRCELAAAGVAVDDAIVSIPCAIWRPSLPPAWAPQSYLHRHCVDRDFASPHARSMLSGP